MAAAPPRALITWPPAVAPAPAPAPGLRCSRFVDQVDQWVSSPAGGQHGGGRGYEGIMSTRLQHTFDMTALANANIKVSIRIMK